MGDQVRLTTYKKCAETLQESETSYSEQRERKGHRDQSSSNTPTSEHQNHQNRNTKPIWTHTHSPHIHSIVKVMYASSYWQHINFIDLSLINQIELYCEQAETIVSAKANSNWGFQYKRWYALNSRNRYSKLEWDTEESAHIKQNKTKLKNTLEQDSRHQSKFFFLLVNELH